VVALRRRLEELAEEGDFDPEDVSFTPESDLAQRVIDQVRRELGKDVNEQVKRRVDEVMQMFEMRHTEDDEHDPLSDDPAELEVTEAHRALSKAPGGSEEQQLAGKRLANVLKRRGKPGGGEGTDPQDRPE